MNKLMDINFIDDSIANIRMNDPEHKNTFTDDFINELFKTLETVKLNRGVRCVILSGMKDIFCAGASKDALSEIDKGNIAVKDLTLTERIIDFPVPVIAAMEGHAVGGGLVLGLSCDIIIMDERSNYGANFTKLGFTPGMGCTRLLQFLVGDYIANELMFTGKTLKGRYFKEKSLVNYVLEKEEVLPKAISIARDIAEKPPKTTEILKYSLNLGKRKALQEARVFEDFMHTISFSNPEVKEMIAKMYNG